MALSSSNASPLFKYDVFLSFSGKDTRYKFTSHLHKALCDKGIVTFIDYDLNRGDEISSALLQAIEESRISLIIFSKTYASSKWCLQELVKILKCKNREMNKQIVIPIFYGVTPTDVRNQMGSYADAFVKHEQHFKDDVQRWRDALKEAGNLSGWPSSSDKSEALFLEAIVQAVLRRLDDLPSNDTSDLVAIDSKVKEITSWLCTSIRSVGICGIGGIGKTTLAKAIYHNIAHQFEGSCFIDDVMERSNQSGGLNHMQQQLLSTIWGHGNANIGSSTFIKKRLCSKKLLIVLDDVSNKGQLESLIEDLNNLSLQSRIIITSRDKHVLSTCRVEKVYEVPKLNYQEALKLFCKHAFKENHLEVDYVEVSNKVIQYTGGVPLALKILGAHLFGKQKDIWESELKKLKKMPHMDIHKVLKISYDGLDDEVKDIFLDIAIFFKNDDMRIVKSFLDACGFETEAGISVLVNKFLIAISYNRIRMHDLLQMMAKEIIRQESLKDPGKRSRLWNHEDICHVLTKNKGTEMIEGISLDMSKIRDTFLNPDAFVKMCRLRFLKFENSCYGEEGSNRVQVCRGLECDFSELRYLHWQGCPLESLPPSIRFENLVTLNMRGSKLQRLWSGVLHLEKLKEIDLSDSNLTICPDLSGSPNLETLMLYHCVYLREIPPAIQCLNKLHTLDLSFCKRLSSIPNCSDLNSHTVDWQNLTFLDLSYRGIMKLPDNLGCLSSLERLFLAGNSFESIPESIINLSRLRCLDVSNCRRIQYLPELPLKCGHLDAHNCTSLQVFSFERFLENAIRNGDELDEDWWGIQACYPGSQIPYWFNFQQMGSSIKVELLPLDLMTMDLAFCIVVAPSRGHGDFFREEDIYWDCQLKSEHVMGDCFDDCCRPSFILCESNHVLLHPLGRLENDVFKEKLCHQGLSQTEIHDFYFHFKISNHKKYHKIIKCGVHLISRQSSPKLGPSLFGGYSQPITVHDKCLDGDEPHPRRLKFSDYFSELPTNQVHNICEEEDEA